MPTLAELAHCQNFFNSRSGAGYKIEHLCKRADTGDKRDTNEQANVFAQRILSVHCHSEQARRNLCRLETQLAYAKRIGDGAFRVHLTQQCPLAACGGRRGQSDGNTGFSNATFASDKEQLTRKQLGWL